MKLEKDTALECLAWTCSLFKYHHLEVMVKGAASEEVWGAALNNISNQTSSTPAEQSSGKITHWAQVWHWNPKPVWIQRRTIMVKNDIIYQLTTLQIFLLSAILKNSDSKILRCIIKQDDGHARGIKLSLGRSTDIGFMPVAHEGQAGHMTSILSAFKKEKLAAPRWLL